MLIITIRVDKPSAQAIGIKEAIAYDLEKYGDVHVINIEERQPPAPKQITMEGI